MLEKSAEAIPPLPILLLRSRRSFIPGLRPFAVFYVVAPVSFRMYTFDEVKNKNPRVLAHPGGSVWNLLGQGRLSSLPSGMRMAMNVFRLIPETQGLRFEAEITLRATAHDVTPRIQRDGVRGAVGQGHDESYVFGWVVC